MAMQERLDPRVEKKNRRTLVWLGLLLVGMTLFAWALVPFYRMVCERFGVGTVIQKPNSALVPGGVGHREITVRFVGMTNAGTPATIEPELPRVTARMGETKEIQFRFTNLSDRTLEFQPVHSVTPARADAMLHKLECFCYERQTLQPNESKLLPLSFWMDEKLDPAIDTVTLQYTLYALNPQRPHTTKS